MERKNLPNNQGLIIIAPNLESIKPIPPVEQVKKEVAPEAPKITEQLMFENIKPIDNKIWKKMTEAERITYNEEAKKANEEGN